MKLLTTRSHSFNLTKPDAIKQGVAFTATTAARSPHCLHRLRTVSVPQCSTCHRPPSPRRGPASVSE